MCNSPRNLAAIAFLIAIAVSMLVVPFSWAATSQWTQTYGGKGRDVSYTLVQTSDGGYAMAGVTNSWGAGGNDFLLIKTDASGTQQWSRRYGGAADDVASAMVKTNDGGFALAGYSESYGAGGKDFWLLKTDSGGNPQWSKAYGSVGDEWARSLIQTSDGGYLLAGQSWPLNSSSTMFLVKTDGGGTIEWNQTIPGNLVAYSVVETNDTGYAAAGIAYGGTYGVYWFTLAKLDAQGNVTWNKTVTGTQNVFFSTSDYGSMATLVQTSDGGYAIAGDDISAGFVLVKTDSEGNFVWSQTYRDSGALGAYAIIQTSDGGFAIAGDAGDWAHIPGFEFCLLKTNSTGAQEWVATFGGSGQDQAYSLVQTGDGYALAGYSVRNVTDNEDFWLVKTGVNPAATPMPTFAPVQTPMLTPSASPANGTEPLPSNSSTSPTVSSSNSPTPSVTPFTSSSIDPEPAEATNMTFVYIGAIAVAGAAIVAVMVFFFRKRH